MDYFLAKIVTSAESALGRTRDRSSKPSEDKGSQTEGQQTSSSLHLPIFQGERQLRDRNKPAEMSPGVGRTALLFCVDALKSTTSFIYDSFQVASTNAEIMNESANSDASDNYGSDAAGEIGRPDGEHTRLSLSSPPSPVLQATRNPSILSPSTSCSIERNLTPPPTFSSQTRLGSPGLSSLTPIYSNDRTNHSNVSVSTATESVGGVSLGISSEFDRNGSHYNLSDQPLLESTPEIKFTSHEISSTQESPGSKEHLSLPIEQRDLFTSPRTFRQGLSLNNQPTSMYSIGYQADSEGESASQSGSSSGDSSPFQPTSADIHHLDADDVFNSVFLETLPDTRISTPPVEIETPVLRQNHNHSVNLQVVQEGQISQVRYRQVNGQLVGPIRVPVHDRPKEQHLSDDSDFDIRFSVPPPSVDGDGYSPGPSTAHIMIADTYGTDQNAHKESSSYCSFQEELLEHKKQISFREPFAGGKCSPPGDYFGYGHSRHGAEPSYSTPRRRAFRDNSGKDSLPKLDPAKLLWRQDSKTHSEVFRSITNYDSNPVGVVAKISSSNNIVTCLCPNCGSPPIGDVLLQNHCDSCGMAVDWPIYIPLPESQPVSHCGSIEGSPQKGLSSPTKASSQNSPLKGSLLNYRSPSKIPVSPRMLAEMTWRESGHRDNIVTKTDDEQIWANGLTLEDMVDATASRKRRDRRSPTRY